MIFFAALLALAVVLAKGIIDDRMPGAQARAQAAVAHWAGNRLHTHGVVAHCPGQSSLHAGARYVCRVDTRAGAIARIRIRIGDKRGVRHRLNLIAYRRRAILPDIRARYRSMRRRGLWGAAAISCPSTFSARPGTTFHCRARFTDGIKGRIVVRVRSRRGAYVWREVGTTVGGRASALH